VPVFIRGEVFEDNDSDDAYLVGYTNSQTGTAFISFFVQRRPSDSNLQDLTTQIHNFDSSSHDYYVYVQVAYMDSPPTQGVFR
jgi:hypothetical protein